RGASGTLHPGLHRAHESGRSVCVSKGSRGRRTGYRACTVRHTEYEQHVQQMIEAAVRHAAPCAESLENKTKRLADQGMLMDDGNKKPEIAMPQCIRLGCTKPAWC